MTLQGKLFCSIYRSSRRAETYLFVARTTGLKPVPQVLLQQFGKPVHVNDLILDPNRPLARSEVSKVMDEIRERGFYLQMPPPPDQDLYLAQGHPDRPRKEAQ